MMPCAKTSWSFMRALVYPSRAHASTSASFSAGKKPGSSWPSCERPRCSIHRPGYSPRPRLKCRFCRQMQTLPPVWNDGASTSHFPNNIWQQTAIQLFMLQFVCDYCENVKQPGETWINGLAAENVGTQAARREVTVDPAWRYERAILRLAVH